MMNRLKISYSELRQQPVKEMLIFDAFSRGEEAALEAKRNQG